MKDSLWFC